MVHKMEPVWSVVESGVYTVCSGANKCVRGPLEFGWGEVRDY